MGGGGTLGDVFNVIVTDGDVCKDVSEDTPGLLDVAGGCDTAAPIRFTRLFAEKLDEDVFDPVELLVVVVD